MNLISYEFTDLVQTCSLHLTASLNNYYNVGFANVSRVFLNATEGTSHMIRLKCELKEQICVTIVKILREYIHFLV